MRVLLDTCVLSEIRKSRGSAKVKQAVKRLVPSDVYISVITLGELVKGVSLLEQGKKQASLHGWILGLEKNFGSSILPIDAETVRLWGELTAEAQKTGHIIPACDGLIAATAMQYGLFVMTRNVKDFEATGAMLINPWEDR